MDPACSSESTMLGSFRLNIGVGILPVGVWVVSDQPDARGAKMTHLLCDSQSR